MSAMEVANGFSISGLLDASAQTANRFPVKEIPLDDISEHPGNVAYSMDEEGIARLAESIERDGLTDLPLVRRLQGGGFQMMFLIEYFFVKSQNKSFGFHGKFFAA